MRVWRISQFPGLSGIGGTYVDGRWHTKPQSIIYAAEHPALAMVEVLAHMKLSAESMPLTLRLLAIDIKKGALISSAPELPSGWQANHLSTQALGNRWLRECKGLVLKCPSAVLPQSFNYLINPTHPQASTHLSETDMGPFWFDARLVQQ
jgi:RES domain-containing protein